VELLRAAGVAYTRLATAGDPATVAAGELHTQSALCDHTKSCIGGFLTGDPVSTALDKVYSPHACGNMKRASEIIGELVPTRLVDVPRNVGEPGSRSFFRSELLALKGDLELLTGRPVDDEAVRAQIAAYNEARRALVGVSALRKRARPPLSGREFVDLARGFWLLPPEQIVADCAAIHERLRRSRSGGGRPPLRLLLCGSIMAHGDRRLLDLVEGKLGARVVAEDHCAGLRPLLRPIREGGDPWQALAEGYLDQSPCASRKPLSAAIDAAGRLAREYAVDGVLYVSLKFCSCYGLPKKAFLDGFQELGLPVLDVSSDYSQSDHGQLATRLEAFVELLEHRREAGLGPDGLALPPAASEGAACP
jgi:benzoyl-CoA reductase/2-hydroxyglutaryl-CoA dehydratase subunit BcrC/BadD/HgdB